MCVHVRKRERESGHAHRGKITLFTKIPNEKENKCCHGGKTCSVELKSRKNMGKNAR